MTELTLDEMKHAILDARQQFRARCRAVLFAAYADADTMSSAVGDVSAEEAWNAWAKSVIEKLAQLY